MLTIPPLVQESESSQAEERRIDERLVERFRGGDESAFLELMNRHRGWVRNLSFRLLKNGADADEITQDTFIRAYRGIAQFRGDASIATWLHRIATNLSRNRYWYFFRRRRHASCSLDGPLGDANSFSDILASDAHNPLQEAVSNEFTDLIARCMEKLDEPHREILGMRHTLGMPYEEIASKLKLNTGTVKSRIARARESLRDRIAKDYPDLADASAPADYFILTRAAYDRPAMQAG